MSILGSIVFLTGCLDVDTATTTQTSAADSNDEQPIPLADTLVDQPVSNDNTASNDKTYIDNELKIDYPRPTGYPVLKTGSTGPEVGWLQTVLNKAMDASIEVDCSFGGYTDSAVRDFQSRCELTVDGAVGSQTIAMLIDIVSGNKKMPEKKARTEPRNTTNDNSQQVDSPSRSNNIIISEGHYILNTSTMVIHSLNCSAIYGMNDDNKQEYYRSIEDLKAQGYHTCGRCHPR